MVASSRPLLRPQEAAERLGVGVETLRLATEIGLLPRVDVAQGRYEPDILDLFAAGEDDAIRELLWPGDLPLAVEPPSKRGFIYFIGADGDHPVKVGWTIGADVQGRLSGLQTGCWLTLQTLGVVPAVWEDERWCHDELAAHRVRGEWFEREAALSLMQQLLEFHEEREAA